LNYLSEQPLAGRCEQPDGNDIYGELHCSSLFVCNAANIWNIFFEIQIAYKKNINIR
jgi:hypothetical protein